MMDTKLTESLKFLDDSSARVLFPSLAKLEGAGDEAASEILDNFARGEQGLYSWMIMAGEELVDKYGEQLFPDAFGGMAVMRFRMQFGIPGHVTLVYEMSDDNYAAVGVSFKDTVPAVMHYNDRSYPVNHPDDSSTDTELLSRVYSTLSARWNDDVSVDWEDYTPFTFGIYPPIVDPRLSLTEEDHPREYTLMLMLRELVKQQSPHAEDILFTSEYTGCNLFHPDLALRTYNRHSDNDTYTWNFVWRDFAVQWYGRFNRSLCMNRRLTDAEFIQLTGEAQSILKNHHWPKEPAPTKPMTPERAKAMADRLMRNGQAGAFGNGSTLYPTLTNMLRGLPAKDDE